MSSGWTAYPSAARGQGHDPFLSLSTKPWHKCPKRAFQKEKVVQDALLG